jgi:hypothetical protein
VGAVWCSTDFGDPSLARDRFRNRSTNSNTHSRLSILLQEHDSKELPSQT